MRLFPQSSHSVSIVYLHSCLISLRRDGGWKADEDAPLLFLRERNERMNEEMNERCMKREMRHEWRYTIETRETECERKGKPQGDWTSLDRTFTRHPPPTTPPLAQPSAAVSNLQCFPAPALPPLVCTPLAESVQVSPRSSEAHLGEVGGGGPWTPSSSEVVRFSPWSTVMRACHEIKKSENF